MSAPIGMRQLLVGAALLGALAVSATPDYSGPKVASCGRRDRDPEESKARLTKAEKKRARKAAQRMKLVQP